MIDCLAAGRQPERDQLEAVGYLVRTTAVYGSGNFGAADRLTICNRPELRGPFQAEMLSVWLTRAFSIDLVEHIAASIGGVKAVTIDPELRRRIGVGNATGLGMAPFLVNHPALINNWMLAREQAIARVRFLPRANQAEIDDFKHHFEQARFNLSQWHSEHPIQIEKLRQLGQDLTKMSGYIESGSLGENHPWDRFYRWAEANLSLEGQEQLVSLMLEPYGDLVDELARWMDADEHLSFFIDGSMSIGCLREIIQTKCVWAISVDYDDKPNRARFWYTSAEKLEPRLGERFDEPGAEYEQPLCVGFFIRQMYDALDGWDDNKFVAEFVLACPQHRHTCRRVQSLATHPYGEIQDNLIAADMLPIDLLRCKLSFFGATRFDPRSDRWVRICMYQDAPFPHELLEAAK